jgi:hypothetical protein
MCHMKTWWRLEVKNLLFVAFLDSKSTKSYKYQKKKYLRQHQTQKSLVQVIP